MRARPHVVIIGGGFGGLYAARQFKHQPLDVTLIDRTNHHLFQPLLYQVATATLAPTDITAPIRWLLRKQENTRVVLAEALITTTGCVVDAVVTRRVARDLDVSALAAIGQWRYEPALLNGVPVPVVMTVTVSFTLQ